MEELSQRDLSHKRDTDLTAEERRELRRRFDDFLAIMRRSSAGPAKPAVPARKVKPWRPKAPPKPY